MQKRRKLISKVRPTLGLVFFFYFLNVVKICEGTEL
nr:MAG TPA: hypothetical protein [Caudoviricetes sp.]